MINLDVRIPKTTRPKEHKLLKISIESSGVTEIQSQIFICPEWTNPKICLKRFGLEFWEYLKKQVDKFKFDQFQYSCSNCIERCEVKCLQAYFWALRQVTYLKAL